MSSVSRMTIISAAAFVLLGACSKKSAPIEKPAGLSPAEKPVAEPDPAAAAPPVAAPPSAEAPSADEEMAMPGPNETISGKITLPKSRAKALGQGDVLFIVARKSGGPPGPGSMLAVQKHMAEDFPMEFTLSERDAMIKGIPFEGKVDIMVRLDKDGDAITRKKGDVVGEVSGVAVGSHDVVIPLATVLTQDVTLGGGPMGGRKMPPGHP